MRYRLYIYKSNAITGSAPAVKIVNRAVSDPSAREWNVNGAAHCMEHFDAEGIKNRIETELGDKCRVKVCFPPITYEQKEFLSISTSYDRITEVLPRVHLIATENRLALYDAETGRSFCKSLFDDAFITLRIREKELKTCIERDLKPVWRIRKISDHNGKLDKESSYCVTLKKDPDKPFLHRVTDLFNCLKNNLKEGEKLICSSGAFIVSGEYYSVTFVLEGYKKRANWICYYDNGRAQQELTRRMGVEEAFKWMECCRDMEKLDIQTRMNFTEMEDKFPNPADRFVNSVRIAKWQRKQVFDIRYGGMGYHNSEILFHIVPSGVWQDEDEISVLKIEEDSASFILPIIHDVYPCLYERYYVLKTHLPAEMWKVIVSRVKEVREMILNDTYNPELEKYIDRFILYVLHDFDDPRACRWKKEYAPKAFIYDHRFEIAYLYEIFIQWSETQLHCYDYTGAGRMFNIQGL